MNSYYITPFPDVYLNLSGGTVTGDTNFTAGLSASTLFVSGVTEVGIISASTIYSNGIEVLLTNDILSGGDY